MRPVAVTLIGLFAAMAFVTAATAAERNAARTRPATAAGQESAQRIIVKFRQSSLAIQAVRGGDSGAATAAADTARMNALASRARITLQGSKTLGGNMHVMRVSPAAGETAAETLARLRADSDVEFAELDRRVYLSATDANDPQYLLNTAADAGQWYLREGQKSAINARGAWDITKGGNGVVIAVVDTGVRFDHPDLMAAGMGGRLLPGYDFISADADKTFATAGDNDGPDEDPSDPGDFCDGDSSSWHGTRVSGIIGARTNNNVGVAGIDWNGYILPVRVIGRCGGYNSDVIAGIRWAAGLSVPGVATNPYPAQVINISLGSGGACDQASAAAISAATAAGSLVVVAAGNETGSTVDSPANCPGAMAVLGLRHAGTKVGFSNLGAEIALGAPGGNCVNTDLNQPCVYSIDTTTNTGTSSPGANGYTDKSSGNTNVGTSFSAPIVAGIAGLMLSVNGNLKSRQLIARMREGATPYPTSGDTPDLPNCQDPRSTLAPQLECICNTAVCGAGMANALGAVQAALRPIAAVTVPASYAAGSSVTLNGSGSGAACNHSVTTYSWSVDGTVISNTSSATLTAPASGTTTVVRLTVTDDAGKTDFADINVGPTSATSTAPTSAGTKPCLTDVIPPDGVAIAATDANAAEASADPGVFTVTRTGSTAAALTVRISVSTSSSATAGADYAALPSTITIPAGSTSATLTVTPIDDTVVESAETVVVSLRSGAGYQVDDAASAAVTIADNDTTAAPPASESGGGGGGGGSFDPLTLLGAFGFAFFAALRRLRGARAAGC
jgi:serine protease